MNWQLQDWIQHNYSTYDKFIQKPKDFEEIITNYTGKYFTPRILACESGRKSLFLRDAFTNSSAFENMHNVMYIVRFVMYIEKSQYNKDVVYI